MSENLAVTADISPEEIRRQRNAERILATSAPRSRRLLLIGVLLLLFAIPIQAFLGNNINYVLHLLLFTMMYVAMASSLDMSSTVTCRADSSLMMPASFSSANILETVSSVRPR